MVKVKMYSDVEGDANVGDEIEVDEQRAQFLVVHGRATYVGPPVGAAKRRAKRKSPSEADEAETEDAEAEN